MDDTPKPPGPLLLEISKYILFQLFRLLWDGFICVWWYLTGIASQWKNVQDPSQYERCAQVLTIRGKHCFDLLIIPNSASQFLVTHNCFTHPNYVLKPEVSLYTVTEDEALFVEAPPGVEVWKLKYGSFHKCAQFWTSIRLIRMPRHAFHHLAAEVGDPNSQLIFMDFLPRSGSTLMCQMFEATGRCVTFSEPELLAKSQQPNSVHQKEDFAEEVVSTIRLLCKPTGTLRKPPLLYLFKMYCIEFNFRHIVPVLKERFPECKLLYMYRNTTESVSSQIKSFHLDNAVRVMLALESLSVKLMALVGAKVFHNLEENKELLKIMRNTSDPTFVQAHAWDVKGIAFFIKQCNSNLKRPAVKYEHLVANPAQCLKNIFKYCDLTEDLIPLALEAMENDSQANSPLCRAFMRSISNHREPSADVVKDIEAVESILGVSTFRKDLLLPNTITVPV